MPAGGNKDKRTVLEHQIPQSVPVAITPDQAEIIEDFQARTGIQVTLGKQGIWYAVKGVPEPGGTWFPHDYKLGPLLRRIEARLRRDQEADS